MKLLYKGELVVESRLGGATCGYGCDEIVMDARDFYDMWKMPAEQLKEVLSHWQCRFEPVKNADI